MTEMKGRCTSCGSNMHKGAEGNVKKNGIICDHCGKQGHLAKVCFMALRQKYRPNEKKDQKDDQSKQKPVRTVAAVDHDSDSSGPEGMEKTPTQSLS